MKTRNKRRYHEKTISISTAADPGGFDYVPVAPLLHAS